MITSNNHTHRQYLQYAAFLAFAYAAVFGWLLISTDFLPYVMDNNESFSSYWHAINLAQFDFFKSFGLTDEAYGYSAAAHPYVYTHQGNFPRLFNLLIYALGARSIESQIAITTFTVGVAAIFMAYHFFSKIANPLFALVCCLLLITDYVLVAQWQVVTYRVWHMFFVFSSLLCVYRMVEGRRFWAALTVLNFACLFYYEFVFVAFVSLTAALYAAFLCWHTPRKLLSFWALQVMGGLVALSILALQLYLYLGWDDFKMDAYLTFVARNHFTDSEELLQRMRGFFDSRNIVFWYNLEDGSKFRTIPYFIASVLYFEFQVHTPFFSTLCFFAFLALLVILIDRLLAAAAKSIAGDAGGATTGFTDHLLRSVPVIGALLLSFIHFGHKYYRNEFGNLLVAEATVAAIAAFVFVGIAILRFNRKAHDQRAYTRKISAFLALVILACNVPSMLIHISYEPILFDKFSVLFIGYILVFLFFAAWIVRALLSGADMFQFTPPAIRMPRINAKLLKVFDAGVRLFLFFSFLSFYVMLFGKDLILGIKDEARRWFEPASNEYFGVALLAAAVSVVVLHYICRSSIATGKPSSKNGGNSTAKLYASLFVLLSTLFAVASWQLYNQRYALYWKEVSDFSLPSPLTNATVMLVITLSAGAVATRGRVFRGLTVGSELRRCGIFLLSGFFAYAVVYLLSPGYIFSGYRFRMVPFTVFHMVVILAFPIYVLLTIGLKFWSRQAGTVHSGVAAPFHTHFSGSLRANSRALAGAACFVTLGFVGIYWIGMQLTYIALMPPTQYSFLNKLSERPYAGQSFLVNTYAAPIAAKTGSWAYFDHTITAEKLLSPTARSKPVIDTTYLWFADKKTNPEYLYPSYYLCIAVQAPSTMIEEVRQRHGLGEGYPGGCENNDVVRLARSEKGKLAYPSLEFIEADEAGADIVGFERWAIIKLNWGR